MLIENIRKGLQKLLLQLQLQQISCALFPQILIYIFLILKSLLNLSYLFEDSQVSYPYVCAILARPQILIRIEIFDTIMIIVCGIYIVCSILPYFRGTPYIAIFGELLRTNLFNCFFELCRGYLRLIPQILLIILFLMDQLLLSGTLNVRIFNFQITKSIWLGQLLGLMSIVQVIMYSYGLNFLQYFTMINSALTLVYYLLYQPYKYQNIILIISSIEFITIYLGMLRLLEIYSSFTSEIVLIPMIFKIIQITLKYYIPKPNFGDKTEFENQIIFASILVQKHQYLKAIKLIEKTQSYRLCGKAKRQILYLECLKQIQILIQTNINSQTRMSEAVKLLMESEKQNTQIQEKLIDVVNQKIKLYQSLLIQKTNVYSDLMEFTKNTEKLLKDLQNYYQNYPSERAQAILGFFYAEIYNDFLSANKIFSVQALLDENSHQKEVISEIFSNKMVYLIAEYNHGLITKRVSNNISVMLPYKADQLIGNKLDMLIPKGIATWHDSMINQFFITGKSRYLRSLQSNFFEENGQLISIDFAIDINFINELQFIAFLQPSGSQPIIIILDEYNEIQSVSQSFYEQIDSKKIENQNITLFIKDFNIQFNEFESIDNTQFILPKHLSRKSKVQQFQTSIHVQRKCIEEQLIYSIVRFEYIRKYNKKTLNSQSNMTLMTSRLSIQQAEQDHLFEEQVAIALPYTGIQEEPYLQQYQAFQQQLSTRIQTNRAQGEQLQSFYTVRVPLQTPIKNSQPSVNNNDKNDQHLEWRLQENDRASQTSSLLGLRKSKYFKKYEIISKLAGQKEYSKYHLLFNSFFFMALFTQIVIGSVQLAQINRNLTNLVSDIDLLQIKNLVFQPVESFLVTRWTIVNYSILLSNGQLNQQKYLTQVAYPRSFLALGYDALAINVNQVLNRKELQDTLQSVNLQVYLYVNTGQGEQLNTTLRGAISLLLNYQYTFKMAYLIEGSVVSDSPYFYYSYKNYQVLKDSLSDLNEQVLYDTKERAYIMEQLTLIIFVITITIATILYLVSLFYFYQITILYQKYVQVILNFNPQIYEEEIIRYQKILQQFQKDQNNLFKYQFNIDTIERYFETTSSDKEQAKKRQKQHKRKTNIVIINWIILLLFIAVIILLNSILTFNQTSIFLSKYPATSELYKQLSDVGTDVPTVYAQREILYGRSNIPYLTQNDFDKLMDQITQALRRIQIFTQQELIYDNYLLSTEFQQYFQSILNSNLCQLIPGSISEQSEPICPLIMSQNMQRGLKSVLVYIFNQINTDKAINQFTTKVEYPYLELEGAFIISQIIDAVNEHFNIDLNSIASELLKEINIQNLILLLFLTFFIYASTTRIKTKLADQYSNVQKFFYMTPRRALLQDDVFERNSKALLMLY